MSESKALSLQGQIDDRGITNPQWHTLSKSLFPGAQPASILMVIDYCRARGLDPMKKPCHIVPMDAKVDGKWIKRDVVMPGIYEYRTTAQKTHQYLGHSVPEYGEVEEYKGVMAPSHCSLTVYRWNEQAQMKAEYPVTVWFSEVVGLAYDNASKEHVVNSRWSRAPRQMLTKCTEAAALREAFPDELGGEMTFEEMVDQPPIEGFSQEPTFTMSKQAVTKVLKAMNQAIFIEDWSAIWEIYQEQSEEEWAYVERQLDRWRKAEWEDGLRKAAEYMRSVNGAEDSQELSEKDKRREAVRASENV